MKPDVRIEPWTDADLDLLRRLNAPEMTRHLGGPETEEKVQRRHERYVAGDGTAQMFRVVLLPDGEAVGLVGYWEHDWQGETVYETGWHVLPSYQGRGIASTAVTEVARLAAAQRKHAHLHAFPSVDNAASNALCRKVGFSFVEECDFEYPRGHLMRCNDWRLDLAVPE
ncbi:MAG: GNAT family N-acetyltransferase [Propionibacteriales bacterium]|nr:GNAT family N-acetyltransferase [Propionibacteriales bacterium]